MLHTLCPCTSRTWWRNVDVTEIMPFTMHVTLSWLLPCCTERRQILSLWRCGQIRIRWTTFKRGSTVRGSLIWRSWKNVCWASGVEVHDHNIIMAAIAQWRSLLNACVYCVRMNGGNFEHKFWASDFLVCFFCFIDTGLRKCDRFKHVQSANIVWNVLLLCRTLSHGMVAT